MNKALSLILCFALAVFAGIGIQQADAAGGKVKSPTGTAPDRYVYYPGTEELGRNEMRVVACGTGMPAARHGQAATCFLAELGNGDKFIFGLMVDMTFPNACGEVCTLVPTFNATGGGCPYICTSCSGSRKHS